jgi:predicted transcriptional regulator
MADAAPRTVVLLPIKPRFARPIFGGLKRVEFRKKRFARRPSHVVVYASSPVKKVVGFFEVSDLETAPIRDLWQRYGSSGGIQAAEFFEYYGSGLEGVAISVGRVTALEEPMELAALGLGERPPQNYAYVEPEVLERLEPLSRPRPAQDG